MKNVQQQILQLNKMINVQQQILQLYKMIDVQQQKIIVLQKRKKYGWKQNNVYA